MGDVSRVVTWVAAFGWCAAVAHAQTLQERAHEAFDRAAPSVVAVRALSTLGERSGAGVVWSEDGLVLTSTIAVPPGARNIRVWFHGARMAQAELVATSVADEVALLRVRGEGPFVPIRVAEEPAQIGDVVFTIGNANNAFIEDDQPAFAIGTITGMYLLDGLRSGATYRGPLFETSAAINPGMAGGPLLNARGEMVAMITMNFSVQRWTGCAIPVAWVRRIAERLAEGATDGEGPLPPAGGRPFVGLEVEDRGGAVVVREVEAGGPAERAGLRAGDRIVRIGRRMVSSAAEVREALEALTPGDMLILTVETPLGESQVRIVVEARP